MEAEYTSIRLAELVTRESVSRFNFAALCDMHHYIFQDIYEWAGKIRIINIEKDAVYVLDKMSQCVWGKASIGEVTEDRICGIV
ncbi:MAG: hypothetical protein K2N15_08025 [Lachnospiraceae bacterium]|nr:hypothetical protein [Lachnospiraceae bacterium]